MSITPGEEIPPYDVSPDSGMSESFMNMSPEEQEKQKEEWRTELAKTEEEILTLRQVLASKVQHSQELKRKLGISMWKEFQDDMSQGIKNVKDSDAYQKTASAFSTTAEKTTTFLGGLGSKLGQIRTSDTFKSFEEKMGTAYTSVRSKIGGSRSNSMQSFDEALKEAEAAQQKSSSGTPATTPTTTATIPEEKPTS